MSPQSRSYGPYNRLLECALLDSPQKAAPDSAHLFPYETRPPIVCMLVLNLEHEPVLFAEIKDDGWANELYTRLLADAQIRQRYDQLISHCPIPRLYGLNLLGTSLRVYCADKVTGKLTPDFVNHHPNANRILPCDFLEGEWDLDILSLDGLKKMQEIVIVAYIKAEGAKRYKVGRLGFSNR